jgi:hypothetical protein
MSKNYSFAAIVMWFIEKSLDVSVALEGFTTIPLYASTMYI